MHDFQQYDIRLVRTSAGLVNAIPCFLKKEKIIIYAADKIIRISDSETKNIRFQLSGHSDTVTHLLVEKRKLYSSSLDGRIIVWDIDVGKFLSKHELRLPIINFDKKGPKYIVLQEKGKERIIHIFEEEFERKTEIFPCFKNDKTQIAANKYFVAAINDCELYLYWLDFGEYTRYKLPVEGATADQKRLTSVACHPTEAIVATGNALGEVMIWWNLTSSNLEVFGKSCDISDDEDETNSEDDNMTEDKTNFSIAKATLERKIDSGEIDVSWRLLHPRMAKRSVMHWHLNQVTAIAFTSEGKHLFSGGLEGVLVKWDLTECFGGHRQRRFFSMLASPIAGVASPGGTCEECIIVTLEKNSFFVLNGAMQKMFQEDSFGQMPLRWRHFSPSSTHVGVLPFQLPSNEPAAVIKSAMGELQVINCITGKVVEQLNVNRKPYVMSDGFSAPVYSEVQLAAVTPSQSNLFSYWLVTYDEMQLPNDIKCTTVTSYAIDNQSRITWWKYAAPLDQPDIAPRFEPVYSESLAYLNCKASDIAFTRHAGGGLQTVLMLRDQRLLVWQCNPQSALQSTLRPWILASCIACDNDMLYAQTSSSNDKQSGLLKRTRLVYINTFQVKAETGGESRDELLQKPASNLLAYSSGTKINVCNWIRWRPSTVSDLAIDELIPITTFDLSTCQEWKFAGSEARVIPSIIGLVHLPSMQSVDKDRNVLAVTLLSENKSIVGNVPYQTGGLCLIELLTRKTGLTVINLVKSDFNVLPLSVAAHPTQAILAVGLLDGSSQVCAGEKMTLLKSFPALPSFPFCDRAKFKRKHRKEGIKNKEVSATPVRPSQIEAMTFFDSGTADEDKSRDTSFRLASIVVTKWGRELGRRDFVVLDSQAAKQTSILKPEVKVSELTNVVVISQAAKRKGILHFAEPVAEVEEVDDNTKVHMAGYKREAIEELESMFRQVSQYPAHTAPPPEQLLAQIFKKPNLL